MLVSLYVTRIYYVLHRSRFGLHSSTTFDYYSDSEKSWVDDSTGVPNKQSKTLPFTHPTTETSFYFNPKRKDHRTITGNGFT